MACITLIVAALVAAVHAGPCKPSSTTTGSVVTPTLPSTGGTTDLPSPAVNMTLKKIAVGHGIQNYTCSSVNASVQQLGALAVLYDVTDLYPGTPVTGLNASYFNALTTMILWTQDIPLNLVNKSALSPGTTEDPNALPESDYAADTANPFPAPADLVLAGSRLAPLKFLGHHFFDAGGIPNFDLSAAGLYGNVVKNNSATAPAGSDAGILATGAVPWLRLTNNAGLSKGINWVYRVITAGGAAEACTEAGEGGGSVPYTAFYWFYE